MHGYIMCAGRKADKQKIGNLRLSVADVVRNGKINDSWALQVSLLTFTILRFNFMRNHTYTCLPHYSTSARWQDQVLLPEKWKKI